MTDQQLIRAAIGDRDGFGILRNSKLTHLETHPRTPFPSGGAFVQAVLNWPNWSVAPFCIQNGTIYIFRRKPTS